MGLSPMTWTEVVTEHIAVVHVTAGRKEERVMVPISDTSDINEGHVTAVKEKLEREVAIRKQRDELHEIVANLDERRRAVSRLEQAGYDRDEIPL
jgi:hypothetical protein